MKDIIYLRVAKTGVKGMTKSMPALGRGEIPVKLEVTIDAAAFREPTLVRQVHITDWREGIDLADVELREAVITEEEAQLIRDRRVAQMRAILESQGYTITAPEPDGEVAGG